ncbi:hypothetical protein RI367_001441 [Sorochytrium milnesiophthora]
MPGASEATEAIRLSDNSGARMPAIGLGTWQASNDEIERIVLDALAAGYRLIDSAAIYGNEEGIGRALHAWLGQGPSHARSELFVSTHVPKLWIDDMDPVRVQAACALSLQKLQVDYLDLYLIHWPVVNTPSATLISSEQLRAVWGAMEILVDQGKVRSIGVSNFNESLLQGLLNTARIKPAVNQIERHPYLPQNELVDFCIASNIAVCAYSPLGSNASGLKMLNVDVKAALLEEPLLQQIAKAHDATPAQVALSWNLQSKTPMCVIPKSGNSERLRQNLRTCTLSSDEISAINSELGKKNIRFFDPVVLYGINMF